MTTDLLTAAETVNTYEKLAVLHHEIHSEENDEAARKMAELAEKVKNREWTIGFCGHFSAGKSTMINRIAGVDLLPSNPIPTTANLAKIRNNDNARAIIEYTNGDSVEIPYPYDLQEIRRSAVDGKVRSIEIDHPLPEFQSGVALLDTPGVDSTDEAHLAAAKSALHLADMIFYVTDYNHVLSELNVTFIKQLQNQNKRLVLIVNQIDKHLQAELEFEDYKKGIAQSFKEHGIDPERIFYTSLKSENLQENQFAELKSFILMESSDIDQKVAENAEMAAKQLIEEHIDTIYVHSVEERQAKEHLLEGMSAEERLEVQQKHEHTKNKLKELEEKPNQLEKEGKHRVNDTLSSAILMPYETREAGRSYVESMQNNFKTGLFGSKKKTDLEREQRLHQFYNKVVETSSSLDWQVKELLVKLADEFGVSDELYKQSIYDMKATIEPELLTAQLQQGATYNADYVLRYTEKAADAIKQLYRKKAYEKLDEAAAILKQTAANQAGQLKETLAEMKDIISAITALDQADSVLQSERERMMAVLEGDFTSSQLEAALSDLPDKQSNRVMGQIETGQAHQQEPPETEETNSALLEEVNDELHQEHEVEGFRKRLNDTAEKLYETAKLIQPLKGFQTTSKEMGYRADRLKNNRFTVALFGAFSAGKSSFANALIGENALPVSPNPTTAAINKILPTDATHPHQSAVIYIKEEAELIEDVQEALRSTDVSIVRLEELPSALSRLKPNPFLENVANGYSDFKDIMGTKQTVDFNTFHEMVSIEAKAVYVEAIELYYDCPLTRQGITLVDTPGADSINARHTDVAFEYIKNADAILFVTYYNHAFSRADREFLIQLGRVKDSFEMDKMFFIVNAADLADSEDELNAVVNYVGKNLQTFGVRHPRIYPVSSKQALADPQSAAGFSKFENAFTRFTMEELTSVAVKAAHDEVKRVVRTLDTFLSSARDDETVRLKRYEAAVKTKKAVLDQIQNTQTTSEIQALSQEINQLLYYIEQRVFLRFPDLFKEIFNPGTLGGNGAVKKETLQNCLLELIQAFGFDLAQEMRATAFRAERFASDLLKSHAEKLTESIASMAQDYSFSAFEPPSFDALHFENALVDVPVESYSKILGLYKNAKQFFEKNGRSEMMEHLKESLKQPVAAYLKKNGERLTSKLIKSYEWEQEKIKEKMTSEANEYADGILSALSVEVDAGLLEHANIEIEKLWL